MRSAKDKLLVNTNFPDDRQGVLDREEQDTDQAALIDVISFAVHVFIWAALEDAT